MLLLKCCIVFALVSSAFSKLDFNFHVDELYDKLKASNKTLTWTVVNETLRILVDSLVGPNLRGIYSVHSKLNVSRGCFKSLNDVVMGLRDGKGWAIKMIDAWGKMPSGVLEGTVMDFGSYDECLKIRAKKEASKYTQEEELFQGKYCMIGYQSPLFLPLTVKTAEGKSYVDTYGNPPDWAHEILVRAAGYLKRTAIWLGTCVPATCTEHDLMEIISIVSKPLGLKVSMSDCQVDEPFVWPSYCLAAASCLGCLVALCGIGTLCDVVSRWRDDDPRMQGEDHVLLRIPKAFSILSNTENLFSGGSGGGNLACFNGIRFLSATWIVLGHTYFYTDTWKYLKYRRLLGVEEQFNGYLPVAVMENFTIPVGSFFFMSGFLLVYTTWNVLEKSQGKINLIMFFIHKFWRMTPALGLTLTLLFCMPLIDSGPLWSSTLNTQIQQCQDYWWANFLFINNWWSDDKFCLLHTWYLSALMQFHIAGILLLLVAFRWPKVGVLLGSLIAIVCAAMTALTVVWNDYPMPAPGMIKDMDIIEDYNAILYIKPFAHFTTYMIGMLIAYIFIQYHDRKISPKYQALGWFLAVAGALSSVYGLYGPADHVAVRALYIVGHRIGWALSIGWMTYVCATGAGGIINRLLSWRAMYSLGQLSYLTYLLHPLVIIYRNASLRERVYYGHTELVFSFLSTLVVSLFLAYVCYVTVETPFAILEKIIFKRRSRANLNKMDYKDNPQITPIGVTSLSP